MQLKHTHTHTHTQSTHVRTHTRATHDGVLFVVSALPLVYPLVLSGSADLAYHLNEVLFQFVFVSQ